MSTHVRSSIQLIWFTITLQANEMIGNIRNAFNELINDLDWMDEETKKLAREKVAYSIPIGYRSYGPRREKTCLRGFRQSEIQTSLLSYRD